MTDRVTMATERPDVVVGTTGLLAAFNNLGVLNPLDVQAAQTIARMLGEDDEQVLLAAALAVRGTRYGHVCIRLDSIREAVVVDGQDPEEVGGLPWPDPAEWQAAVEASPLISAEDAPLVFEQGRLYLQRYHHYETQVATLLLQRCEVSGQSPQAPLGGKGPPPQAGAGGLPGRETLELLSDLLEEGARQHDAARRALTSPLAVIAGGPGTGKTHTIAAMLASLAADPGPFPRVALCAPTGKAAARLGEALTSIAADINNAEVTEALATVEPRTIHRLLGWTWDRSRFAHHEKNRLPHDLVIVDEMSMVSLPMAAKLLSAVRNDPTVVLVGDPSQLESIEAGTVLADIVGAGEADDSPISNHVVILDRVHRFDEDSAIADLAEAVRSGDADSAVELLRQGGDHLSWVEGRSEAAFDRVWERIVDQRVRLVELASQGVPDDVSLGHPNETSDILTVLGSLAVLCARRTGRDGVSGWGREIEHALDERFTGLRWGGEWYPGRPVMITSNDYNLELYNGDIGVCVETPAGLRVLFDQGREFPPSHLSEHTTVHAMTIHKSQGSQFDEVVVVLPNESSRLLTRELLYTAVTRAADRVSIIGDEDVVRAAVERSVQRASGLGPRLTL